MKYLPYFLIVLVLLIAGGIYIDKTGKNKTLNNPAIITPLSTATQNINSGYNTALKNYGPAPELLGINHWLNSDPLTLASLKGKVVLIDFWTYSCINCIRTMPYITKWYETYKDQGFVIIGVHTPEFAFEKVTENVATAIKRFGINYPVAQDNNYETWNAYQNRYWPAHYLIDKQGVIRYVHFGEGEYEETENIIRYLLGLDANESARALQAGEKKDIRSPEIYFGTARIKNIVPGQAPTDRASVYALPKNLELNQFALSGEWKFSPESARLTRGSGKILLKFYSGKLHMVAKSDKEITLKITVDGQARESVTVKNSDLYTLFDSDEYKEHVIEIEIPDAPASPANGEGGGGFEAFTFTFG